LVQHSTGYRTPNEGAFMESVTFEQHMAGETAERLSENSPVTTLLRDSVALRRIMDEVRNKDTTGSQVAATYDRAHNRHNR
jgi:hypothetical protein